MPRVCCTSLHHLLSSISVERGVMYKEICQRCVLAVLVSQITALSTLIRKCVAMSEFHAIFEDEVTLPELCLRIAVHRCTVKPYFSCSSLGIFCNGTKFAKIL